MGFVKRPIKSPAFKASPGLKFIPLSDRYITTVSLQESSIRWKPFASSNEVIFPAKTANTLSFLLLNPTPSAGVPENIEVESRTIISPLFNGQNTACENKFNERHMHNNDKMYLFIEIIFAEPQEISYINCVFSYGNA